MDLIAVAIVDLKAGTALDWAVAKAVGKDVTLELGFASKTDGSQSSGLYPFDGRKPYSPSTNWAQGGPLLAHAELLTISKAGDLSVTQFLGDIGTGSGDSPNNSILESICKAIVAAKFGDAVTVPRELVEVQS